jgi:hypothetical protein
MGSRTKIGGNRISEKSIHTVHLADDFIIPEKMVELTHPTHAHPNKAALDIIKNTNPDIAKYVDLKDVVLTIMEVSEARAQGKTLANTLDAFADKISVDSLTKEVVDARGEYSSLSDALRIVITEAQNIIDAHAGLRSHQELDKLYTEVESARGGYDTLGARLADILGGPGGGTGGTVNVTMLTPWTFRVTVAADQTVIDLPNTYTVGTNNLQVFEGPILLYPGDTNDYKETSSSQITLNYEIPEGTELTIIGVNAGRMFEWVMYSISTAEQSEINFIDTYRPGERELMVYEDGLLLQPGNDYEEVSGYKIRMVIPFKAHSNIAVFKRRY